MRAKADRLVSATFLSSVSFLRRKGVSGSKSVTEQYLRDTSRRPVRRGRCVKSDTYRQPSSCKLCSVTKPHRVARLLLLMSGRGLQHMPGSSGKAMLKCLTAVRLWRHDGRSPSTYFTIRVVMPGSAVAKRSSMLAVGKTTGKHPNARALSAQRRNCWLTIWSNPHVLSESV